MKIGIQCESMGYRCGIYTYAKRLMDSLNKVDGIDAKMFVNNYRWGEPDIISVQYEPGMVRPNKLYKLLQKFVVPVVVTAHHTLNLSNFYGLLDGVVIHDESQIEGRDKPWDYKVIPHPAVVYPKKDKKELREKYGLPLDKKIIGTMGFIAGTGKALPLTVSEILKRLKNDEFLYLITSFWKGGDLGRYNEIKKVVKMMGRENQFRMDTDFVDESVLNDKMQACDLLYGWNLTTKDSPGSQSGSAADMYGARVKLIVKDVPHFSFIANQDKVLTGRSKPDEFAIDVLNALRNEDLNDVQDPEWLSWDNQVKNYIDYFEELL